MGIERSLFRTMLPEWSRLGFSGSAMIRQAGRMGIATYRRKDMLSDIRSAQDRVSFGNKLMDFPGNQRPVKSVMAETELRAARKYRVFGTFQTRDTETGRVQYEHKSFYTDTLRTKADFADEFMGAMDIPEISRYKIYEAGDITLIEHNTGWRY